MFNRKFAVGLAAWTIAMASTVSLAAAQRVEVSHNVFHVAVCPQDTSPGFMRCHAHVVTDAWGRALVHNVSANLSPPGYTPANLRSAYSVTGTGSSSVIVAVVDAYGYPNAESNLGVYRSQFGLPACTTQNGCFKKVNEAGKQGSYPPFNVGWAQETALDLDMVSAMCPNCKILLVEASSSSANDLATAVNTAASLGAHAISNSYGGSEAGTGSIESAYNHSGVAVTASSGDSGYGAGPQFPATSPHVIAVGGTTLVAASNARGWSETAWSGAGSGCSSVYGKPVWQNPVDSFCANRTEADVSAIADPSTGVAVYAPVNRNKASWQVYGGTSVGAPLIAGIYGVNGGAVDYGSNPYGGPSGAPYSSLTGLNDVTSGSNGNCGGSPICTAVTGYDGPTGLGTPSGVGAF